MANNIKLLFFLLNGDKVNDSFDPSANRAGVKQRGKKEILKKKRRIFLKTGSLKKHISFIHFFLFFFRPFFERNAFSVSYKSQLKELWPHTGAVK